MRSGISVGRGNWQFSAATRSPPPPSTPTGQVEIACDLDHGLVLVEHQPHHPHLELIGEPPALTLPAGPPPRLVSILDTVSPSRKVSTGVDRAQWTPEHNPKTCGECLAA